MRARPLVLGFLLAAATTVATAATIDVVATGLANPRGIAFAPDGTLWVAESGSGGDGACIVGSNGETECYGETGALTRIDPDGFVDPVRVVPGLPSIAPAGGFGATGPSDVSFQGKGGTYVVIGLGANPSARAGLGPKSSMFGTLLKISAGGIAKTAADVAAHEAATNSDGGAVDTNPYGVAALPSRQVVADAGGNDLVEVRADGSTRTLAVFPPRLVPLPSPPFPPDMQIPMQAVPTAVAEGPDGALYVAQLTGFPFPIDGARIYRVPAAGGAPTIAVDELTNVVDLAFDRYGDLYVLEIGHGLGMPPLPLAPPGRLLRIAPDGSRTVVADGFFYPGGVAVAPNGDLFVTVNGISPTDGQVVRIRED